MGMFALWRDRGLRQLHQAIPADAILTASSAPERVRALGGGKGYGLCILTRHGICVPRWAIVTTPVFREFTRRSGLNHQIADVVRGLHAGAVAKAASEIEELILEADIDNDVADLVARAHDFVSAERVAVRSSGADEDGTALSFAGQHSSFLGISGQAAVLRGVRRCWASAYSARSLMYRLSHRLPINALDMAVIIQEMVAPEKSGVVFTANPTSGRRDELVVSAIYGLGEGLVSGTADADTLVLDRNTGAVKAGIVRHLASNLRESCHALEHDEPVLDESEAAVVAHEALRIEQVFGCPQDIEWSIERGKLKILQSRAITTMRPRRATGGEARIWDNSNIIESFSGVTLPMTFSFANDVYRQVYREYCRLLGVPRRYLEQMDEWLATMLGYHNGRVYYNLVNWYKVIRFSPFYRLNRQMLELALGVQEPLDEEWAERLHPIPNESRIVRFVVRAVTGLRSWWHFLRIEAAVKRFVRDFHSRHREFDAMDYSTLAAETIDALFRRLQRELLPRWGRMILLEQALSLSIGMLSVLTRRWLPDAPDGLLYEVARPRCHLDSLRPVERLIELADAAALDEELSRLILDTAPADVYQALSVSPRQECQCFVRAVRRYIDEFGYRNVNELKLEEPDMRDDPSVFFGMLQSLLRRRTSAPSRAASASAGTYLDDRLWGWRRIVYEVVRRKASRCLAARERVRFCRTLAFGSARRMLKAIGQDLVKAGAIDQNRDIFYLRLGELRGWFDGIVSHSEVISLIELRKRQEVEYEAWEAPPRFATGGVALTEELKASGWSRRGAGTQVPDLVAGPRELRGTPCSPGRVEGEALVVSEPCGVEGKVVVTYRTDPGWCTVLPSVAALLIERGSPLTHVAIVARELGIPTVVQIKDLTKRVTTGMLLTVDGEAGTVRVSGA